MRESSESRKGIQGPHRPRFQCGLAHILIELASRAVLRRRSRASTDDDAEPRRLVLADANQHAVAVCPAFAPGSHPGDYRDCEEVGYGQELRCCRRMYESNERKAPKLRATSTEQLGVGAHVFDLPVVIGDSQDNRGGPYHEHLDWVGGLRPGHQNPQPKEIGCVSHAAA